MSTENITNNEAIATENTTNNVTETTENATNTQPRWKSWALWVSILGAIGLILSTTGVFAKIGLTSETWNTMIAAVGTILTAFGLVNNPTNKSGF